MRAELHFQQQLLSNSKFRTPSCVCVSMYSVLAQARLSTWPYCVQPLVLWMVSGAVVLFRGVEPSWHSAVLFSYADVNFPVIHFHFCNNKIWRGRREESIMCLEWESEVVMRGLYFTRPDRGETPAPAWSLWGRGQSRAECSLFMGEAPSPSRSFFLWLPALTLCCLTWCFIVRSFFW